MKEFFCTLFILCVLVVFASACLPIIIPVITFGISLMFLAAFAFIWLLPILIIATSEKTTGGEKLAWILAIVFLSWFAWIFYFLLAPISGRRCRYETRGHRRSRYDRYYDDYEYRY